MISLFRHGWKGGPNASRLTFYRIEMEYQRLVSGFSTVSSPFRIVSHVNNLEDPSVPFVILETSFLSKFNSDSSKYRMLQYLEKVIRSQGAVPISLGMLDGNILIGLTKEEAKTLCFTNKKMLCCDRSTISQYCTQNSTAFISPSAALHIGNMYHIPVILSGEIACISQSDDKTVHQDVASLHKSSSIMIANGFHPYQDLQKSVDYLESKHIGVYTLNMNTIPSCMGCKSYYKAPRVFDKEEKLLASLKEARSRNESVLLFSGSHSLFKQEDLQVAIQEANKIAIQKVSPANRYRYIEKLLFNNKKFDMKTALYKVMERNAILASKIAISFSSPTVVLPHVQELDKNPNACTYSIYNIFKQKKEVSDLALSLSVVEVVKNNLSLPDQRIQKEIDKTIDSIVESKLRYPSDNNSLWKQELPSIQHPLVRITQPQISGSYLVRPKETCPVFITSDYYVTQYQETDQGLLTDCDPLIGNHSYFLYQVFTSLTRETPPFHISIRGADDLSKTMTELSRKMGDAEYGTTFVSGTKTPEVSEFYNSQGVLVNRVVDDLLFHQVGSDYVKKHEKMIMEAPILITDGQINRAVCTYLSSVVKNRGIPLFMDCTETTSFSTLLSCQLLSACDWLVLNETSLQNLLGDLNETKLEKEWKALMRANTMKCDDLRSKLEEIMIVMKKQLVPSSNMTVLLSLQNCGEWIVTLGTSDVSITWVRGNTKTNQYGNAGFETGYLWGILNQYPLDLSISLGQIVQQQVLDCNSLFGKTIHKSCLANQIVKYMTGINSFDLYLVVCYENK